MSWLSFCLYCGDCTTEQRTCVKWHNPVKMIQTQGWLPKTLKGDLRLGFSCASSCLFSVASVSTRRDRFHHKGCLLFRQGRNMFLSGIRTISSVNRKQTQFWFKTKKKILTKTPTLGDLALAKVSLEDSKVKTLAKGGEGNRNAVSLRPQGWRVQESSQDLCAAWTRWPCRNTLLKHKPKKWV